MKSAFISGAFGQDAYFLTELLLSKGYKVNLSTRKLNNKIKKILENRYSSLKFNSQQLIFTELNLLDRKLVVDFFKKNNFDEVYNLAGQSNVLKSFLEPKISENDPLKIYNNLIEGMLQSKKYIKLFQATSSEIFEDCNNKKIDEKTKLNPKSPYAIGKAKVHLEIEKTRKQNDIFAVSGIMFNHESELRNNNYLFGYIVSNLALIIKKEINTFSLSNLNTIRDWGYAKEYVNAMWIILNSSEASDYIISTGKSYSVQEIINCAFNEVNLDYSKHINIVNNPQRSYDVLKKFTNPEKIYKDLFWKAQIDGIDVMKLMIKKLIKNKSY